MDAAKLWGALALVAGLAAGCGQAGSPGSPGAGGSGRPEAPLTVAAASQAVPVQWRVRAPASTRPGLVADPLDQLAVRAGRAEVHDGALVMSEGDAVALRWSGPFETRQLGSLEVLLDSESEVELELFAELVQRGRRLGLEARTVELLAGAPTRVRFALPLLPPERSEFAALELRISGSLTAGVRVRALGLPWRAPAPWRTASEPEGGVADVEFGGDGRPSLLLRSGDVARARVRLAGAGSVLVFGYGRSQRTPGRPAGLSLTVAAAGEPPRALELDPAETWHTARVPLPGEAGDLVEVALELDAAPGEVFVGLSESVVVPPDDPRPDVVLVTSDTHRGDHLGAAGPRGASIQTPVLDALAARGVLFEDCFATSHVTLPSHAAMFTGTHPRDTGIVDNNTVLAADAPTLAEAFRDAGYLTCAATSMTLLADGHSGFGQGFQRRDAPDRTRSAAETVAVALRWLEEAGPRPIFLWVHVADAHAPYEPPAEFLQAYWPTGREAFDPALPAQANAPRWLEDVRDLDYVRALYRGEVSYLDAELGPLLAHPRMREAVLAVTGDHGESLGAHGYFWRHKGLYPDTLHVPLILAWPGAPAGTRVVAPVGHLDLGRTLLDLAGLDAAFPGQALAGPGADAAAAGVDRFAISTGRRSASITRGGLHLIQHLVDEHRVELFDLARDPAAATDLVEERRDEARGLRVALLAWLAEAAEGGQGRWAGERHTDAETLETLAALGYADQLEDDGSGALGLPSECPCAWCRRFR